MYHCWNKKILKLCQPEASFFPAIMRFLRLWSDVVRGLCVWFHSKLSNHKEKVFFHFFLCSFADFILIFWWKRQHWSHKNCQNISPRASSNCLSYGKVWVETTKKTFSSSSARVYLISVSIRCLVFMTCLRGRSIDRCVVGELRRDSKCWHCKQLTILNCSGRCSSIFWCFKHFGNEFFFYEILAHKR